MSSTGQLGLTWYDFRKDDPATAALTTDVWFRTVSATGSHISDEQHLSGPFNFAAAPDAGGRFVGDYQGMTSIGSRFQPFFAITNCLLSCPANRTDIFSIAVRPSADLKPSSQALPAASQNTARLAPQAPPTLRRLR